MSKGTFSDVAVQILFVFFSLRAQILKYLHSRHVLIFGCVLVVLECMCIMAELMVDLQGIRSE